MFNNNLILKVQMKKKIVNGFLMLALIVSSMGSFVSCKDYDEDMYVDLKDRIANEATLRQGLEEQIKRLESSLAQLENDLKNVKQCTCTETDLSDYVKKVDLEGYLTTAMGEQFLKVEDYAKFLANHETAIKLLQDAIDKVNGELASLKQTQKDQAASITEMLQKINAANDAALEAKALADQALKLAQENLVAIKALQGKVDAQQTTINNLTTTVNNLKKTVEELNSTIINWNDDITTLVERTKNIVAQVESNTERIAALEDAYNKMLEDLKLLVNIDQLKQYIDEQKKALEEMQAKWALELEQAKQEALDASAEAKAIAEQALAAAGSALSTSNQAIQIAANAEQMANAALQAAAQAVKAAQDALAQVQIYVEQAKKYRDEAECLRNDALALKLDAKLYMEQALKYRNEAKEWAEKAEEWAKSISGGGLTPEQEQAIKDAKKNAQDALDKANEAEQKAAAAETKAANAETKAANAEALAQAADTKAQAAQDKADALETKYNNLLTTVSDLTNRIAALEGIDHSKYATNTDLNNKYNELLGKYNDLKAIVDALPTPITCDCASQIAQLATDIATLTEKVNGINLSDYVKLSDLQNAFNNYATSNEFKTLVQNYVQEITDLSNYYTKAQVDALINALADSYVTPSQLSSTVQDLKDNVITPINTQMQTMADDISELKFLQQDYNTLITNILIQGTECPTLGYFNAPLDTRSTMLIVYYGDQSRFFFPSSETFTDEELANIGVSNVSQIPGRVKHNGGKFVSGDGREGNAGKVYMTVNPFGAKLDGKTWSLVNSQNVESGVKLSTPVASSKTLKFGYSRTRSGSEIGFYESKATLTTENIKGNTVLEIGLEELKDDVSDAIKTKTKNSILNTAASLIKSINNKVEANAIKAEWTDNTIGRRTITSDFSIAATAITPLTIDFLQGFDDINVPGRTKVMDLIAEMIHQIEVDVPDIEIDVDKYFYWEDVEVLDGNKVYIRGKGYINGSLQTVYLTLTLSDGDFDTVKQLQQAVLSTDNGSLASVNIAEILNSIQQLNTMDDEWAIAIDDTKENMIENLDKYVAKAFDKLDVIVNKAWRALNLIIIARQESNGAFALLSGTKKMPTKASGTISLWPTSYTLELFAPAYKKVIAVTNVTPVGGGASNTALANQANQGQNMATVIDGDVAPEFTGKAGYIYEITYAAVDYHAKEHKVKFYVQF